MIYAIQNRSYTLKKDSESITSLWYKVDHEGRDYKEGNEGNSKIVEHSFRSSTLKFSEISSSRNDGKSTSLRLEHHHQCNEKGKYDIKPK